MSHVLDLDETARKLVLLQHYCAGSREYCRVRMVGSENDIGNYEYDNYWGWTKGIVSNYLLECSIKLRVIQDTFYSDYAEFKKMDKEACGKLEIGNIEKGNFELNLRETSNKIIHAKNVTPTWVNAKENEIEFQYWDGKYALSGFKNKQEWKLILNVSDWARALESFIELFKTTDNSHYLGQDFINEK
jgi:hypothetical protein